MNGSPALSSRHLDPAANVPRRRQPLASEDWAGANQTAGQAAVLRAERALEDGLEAVEGTAHAGVFTRTTADKFRQAVHRAAHRVADLDRALGALAAGAEPEGAAPAERGRDTGRIELETRQRLLSIRAATAAKLDELVGLLEALRARFLLARFEEVGSDEVSELIAEARAHIELRDSDWATLDRRSL